MNKVDVKYNPFLPELTVLINNKPLSKYSSIMAYKHKPFSDWCSRFFDRINSEVNDDYVLKFTGTEFENEIIQVIANQNAACKSYEFKPIRDQRDIYYRLSEIEALCDDAEPSVLNIGLWAEEKNYSNGLLELMKESAEYTDYEEDTIVSQEIPLVRSFIRSVDFAEDLLDSDIAIALSQGGLTEEAFNHLQRLGKTVFLIDLSDEQGFDGKKINVFCFQVKGDDVVSRINKIIEGVALPAILSDREYRLQQEYERGDLLLSAEEKEKLDLSCAIEKVYQLHMPDKTFVGRTSTVVVNTIPSTSENEAFTLLSRDGLLLVSDLEVEAIESGNDVLELYVEDNPIPVASCDVQITDDDFIEEIVFERSVYNIPIGEITALNYDCFPENAVNQKELKWKVSNQDIAAVDSGKIEGLRPGTVSITAYTQEATSEVIVNVLPHVNNIILSETIITLAAGDQREWYYSLVPDAQWEETTDCIETGTERVSSSNDRVAFFRGNHIIANEPGNATIFVTVPNTGLKAACRVTVTRKGIF